MGFVIVLCVFLIASIATMVNSIDLTILTIYGYTRSFTYAIPQRVSLRIPDKQIKIIKADPRVDRVFEGSVFFTNIKTVMGRFPFVVLGVTPDNRDYLLKRVDTGLLSGRMPAEGMPEAALSEPIAQNKKIKIGDIIAGPTDAGGISGSPVAVRCVGILRGPVWFAVTSKSFCDQTFITSPRCLIYTTKKPSDLFAVNNAMLPPVNKNRGKLDGTKLNLLSYQNLVHELRDSLSSMFLIMGVVNGTVIFVISLMSGMLANIYFTQRISEFAVLSAIGYRRSKLIGRIVAETALLTTIGWLVGALVTVTFLTIFKTAVFEPRGLIIDPQDLYAYKWTIPIPFAITAFAVTTISIRLMKLDPVSIIERR